MEQVTKHWQYTLRVTLLRVTLTFRDSKKQAHCVVVRQSGLATLCSLAKNGGRIKVATPVKRVEVRRLAFIGFGCVQ